MSLAMHWRQRLLRPPKVTTELQVNSNIAVVNHFSRLSLDSTADSDGQQLVAGRSTAIADPLSDDLMNRLTINDANDVNNSVDTKTDISRKDMKKAMRNKKKRVAKRRLKLKITKTRDQLLANNVFKMLINKKKSRKLRRSITSSSGSGVGGGGGGNDHQKTGNLFTVRSSVIKELKVSALGGMSADDCRALIGLRDEGVVRKVSKVQTTKQIYKCLLCKGAPRMASQELAQQHIQSSDHQMSKCEQKLSKNDRLLALNLDPNADIEVLLARKRQLSQITNSNKRRLYLNTIRLDQGFGCRSFVCQTCNGQPLASLDLVLAHIRGNTHRYQLSTDTYTADPMAESLATLDVNND